MGIILVYNRKSSLKFVVAPKVDYLSTSPRQHIEEDLRFRFEFKVLITK